jgi:TRAP-type C4-dicarboxylate transport system permease small subunit
VLKTLRLGYERLMEAVVIVLMVAMSVVVTLGIVYRTMGASLVWYDEIAAIGLAWLTYYGAALGALKRAHIGVPEIMRMLPPGLRAVLFCVAEAFVFGFFALAAWIGYEVVEVLAGSTLVSLDWVSEQVAQSVIPIGAVLFIIGQALSLPTAWRKTMSGDTGHRPIDPNAEMAATE